MIGNFVYFLARGIMAECARKGEKMERIERERISGQEPVEAGMADGQEPEKTEMAGGQEPEMAEMAGGQEPESAEMAGGQEMDGQAYDRMRLEIDSLSRNEEFARVVVAVFMSRMNPTLEEIDDVKTAASEAVTNAVIHGYRQKPGIIYIEAEIHGQMFTLTVKDKGDRKPEKGDGADVHFRRNRRALRHGIFLYGGFYGSFGGRIPAREGNHRPNEKEDRRMIPWMRP